MSRALGLSFLLLICVSVSAQNITVHGHVEVIHRVKGKSHSGDVVVWLVPDDFTPSGVSQAPAVLVQKDKRVSPHVLAVQTGTEIEFPNRDPFFHDVFSIYRGKPFDLGLYESGSVRKVRFSQPGISYIFCNLHPEMSATVLVVPTPYFAVTSSDGSLEIDNLPAGHYKMAFWYELASESELTSLAHELEISKDTGPVSVTLHSSDIEVKHLNKYGQQYPPEKPNSY